MTTRDIHKLDWVFWAFCMGSKTAWKLVSYVALVLLGLSILMAALFTGLERAHASSRIKDIVTVEGIRENMLIGYGLVVGLNGTGDKLNNSVFTEKSLASFLERLGISTQGTELKTQNVAAVTVSASLPPFARVGGRMNVTVSALGDATSLQGGTLLPTPLMGADGEIYAVAQGTVTIEGFEAGGDSATVSKGVPTTGFLPDGAIVEREVAFDFNTLSTLNLALRNPDVSTAKRIAKAINLHMSGPVAEVRDPGTVTLDVPKRYRQGLTHLLAEIEQLRVQPDQVARVVIDEASGTIVMGENVRIDEVAVAQGNLVVRITETPQVSQPVSFAPESAETVEVPRTTVVVEEGGGVSGALEDDKFAVLETGANLRDLVTGLNALGVGPRDLISILQTIKVAGAMQAELETR